MTAIGQNIKTQQMKYIIQTSISTRLFLSSLLLYISTAATRWLMDSQFYHALGLVLLKFSISVQSIKAIVSTALFINSESSKKEESTRFVEFNRVKPDSPYLN